MDSRINWDLILRTAPTRLMYQELGRRVQERGKRIGRPPTCACGACKLCRHRRAMQAYRLKLKKKSEEG